MRLLNILPAADFLGHLGSMRVTSDLLFVETSLNQGSRDRERKYKDKNSAAMLNLETVVKGLRTE
jgi:hypothetical protein